MNCYACGTELTPEHGDTDYQFDNALWITLDGGYGMFIEDEAFELTGEFWQSLPEERRIQVFGDLGWEPTGLMGCPMPLPESLHDEWRAYVKANQQNRIVICHTCAHDLCDKIPWLAQLINPYGSHSHHVDQIPQLLAQGHQGWDLDKEYEKLGTEGDEAKE